MIDESRAACPGVPPSGALHKERQIEGPYVAAKTGVDSVVPDLSDGDNRSAAALVRARLLGKGARELATSILGSQGPSKGSQKVFPSTQNDDQEIQPLAIEM